METGKGSSDRETVFFRWQETTDKPRNSVRQLAHYAFQFLYVQRLGEIRRGAFAKALIAGVRGRIRGDHNDPR